MTSICTAALELGAAGFVPDNQATSHRYVRANLSSLGGRRTFLASAPTIFRLNKVRFECSDCALLLHDAGAVHCNHCGRADRASRGLPRDLCGARSWVHLVYLVYLVCLVCLVKSDSPDQRDETDKPDRPDKIDQTNRHVLSLYATVATSVIVAGLPHIPILSTQFRSKLWIFLQESPDMGVRRQGLSFAVPRYESNGMVCSILFLAGAYMMRVVLLSAAVVLILTGVTSHRAISAGGLSQHSARLVTLRGKNLYASE